MSENLVLPKKSEYRNPPEDWMNPIPESWDCKKARYCLQERDIRTENGNETLLSLSNKEGLVPHKQLTDDEPRADSLAGYKICKKGDIVMNKMQAWNGVFGVADQRGIVSPDYTVLELNEGYSAKFYSLLFQTPMYITQFRWRSRGIGEAYLRLHTTELKNIPVYAPPYQEQEQIVEYIKSENSSMEEIEQKISELSSLMSERLNSLISDRVISGGEPPSVMKESKITWIEEVPSHWTESKLKYVSDSIIDSEHKTASVDPNGNYHIIRTSDVRDGEIKLDQTQMTNESVYEEWTQRGKPSAGDIILTREAPAGEVGIVPPDAEVLLGQRTVLIKPDISTILPTFLSYVLRSDLLNTHISLNSRGSTVSHINLQDLKEIPVIIPPINEQKEIVSEIDSYEEKYDSLKQSSESMVSYLNERKKSILTAVTTGQIDVVGKGHQGIVAKS